VKWADVPPLWQGCFELAWEAHLEGSNPIAALIADPHGQVVATGKSAVRTPVTGVVVSHNEIAHAEINALLGLDNRVHGKALAATYTLYVSLEPCPVCFSAFYMSDIETLCYAARDRYGGSTNLLETTPYLSRKKPVVVGPEELLEDFSIFLNVAHDLAQGAADDDPVHELMAIDYPRAVAAARTLAADSERVLVDAQSLGWNFDRFTRWWSDG